MIISQSATESYLFGQEILYRQVMVKLGNGGDSECGCDGYCDICVGSAGDVVRW